MTEASQLRTVKQLADELKGTPLKNQGVAPVGETRDAVSRAVGMSGTAYYKAKEVVAAAEAAGVPGGKAAVAARLRQALGS